MTPGNELREWMLKWSGQGLTCPLDAAEELAAIANRLTAAESRQPVGEAQLASLIERQLGFTNGWAVDRSRYTELCQEIAKAWMAAQPVAPSPIRELPQLDNWVAEFSLTDESDVFDEFTLEDQAMIWGLMRIAWNTAASRTAALLAAQQVGGEK